MDPQFDISVCINLHREGKICQATIDSAKAAIREAQRRGLLCELVLVLDNPDGETERTAALFQSDARILQVSVGDLGEARNLGIAATKGRYCALLDGDDLFGDSWLWAAFSELKVDSGHELIVHPRINLFFGRDTNPYYWVHPDMRSEKFVLSRLIVENLWTSLSFARKNTFLNNPYVRNRIADGFGYEDWSWNIKTVLTGILHVTAADTIHFIRKKSTGSLLQDSIRGRVIPDLHTLGISRFIVSSLRGDAAPIFQKPVSKPAHAT